MPRKLHFPVFTKSLPVTKNINEIIEGRSTPGQRAADAVARTVGSWRFIIIQSVILMIWVILNVTAWMKHWDPYPFILMNLVLSLQAAYTAPVIMMSQNRQVEHDRLEAHNDYQINVKAEQEILAILEHLDAQNTALTEIHDALQNIEAKVE